MGAQAPPPPHPPPRRRARASSTHHARPTGSATGPRHRGGAPRPPPRPGAATTAAAGSARVLRHRREVTSGATPGSQASGPRRGGTPGSLSVRTWRCGGPGVRPSRTAPGRPDERVLALPGLDAWGTPLLPSFLMTSSGLPSGPRRASLEAGGTVSGGGGGLATRTPSLIRRSCGTQ